MQSTESAWVHTVCMWGCLCGGVLDGEGRWVFASLALVVVWVVSNRLQWLFDQFLWTTFTTLRMSHWFQKVSSMITKWLVLYCTACSFTILCDPQIQHRVDGESSDTGQTTVDGAGDTGSDVPGHAPGHLCWTLSLCLCAGGESSLSLVASSPAVSLP